MFDDGVFYEYVRFSSDDSYLHDGYIIFMLPTRNEYVCVLLFLISVLTLPTRV